MESSRAHVARSEGWDRKGTWIVNSRESEYSAYSAKVLHGWKSLRSLEPLTLNQNGHRSDGGGADVVRLPFSDTFFLL